jgi:hypothetical protein
MKNGKRKVIGQIARPGLVLAALLAMVFSTVSIGRAQLSATSITTPSAKPTAAPAVAPALPASKPPVKGQYEGIKIHGYWTIEVRNRDGSVASHTEFENSYISGSVFPNFLSRIVTIGEWGIVFGGSPSPCVAGVSNSFSSFVGVQQNVISYPVCVITESGPAISPFIYGSGSSCDPAAGTGSCSNNLMVGLDANTGNPTLTGSVVATNSGTISQVETIFSACGPALSGTACATETTADSGNDLVSAFTATNLPASGSGLCGGANQPPCAVPVIAQQTIQVSVEFSFQ